jgi:hypothetical protein
MAVETDTERTVLLADFGVTGSYTADGESAVSITVIFDKPYIGVGENGEVVVEQSNPTCLCRASDVSNADHAATIVIESVTYNVVGVQPDGTGFTILELQVN